MSLLPIPPGGGVGECCVMLSCWLRLYHDKVLSPGEACCYNFRAGIAAAGMPTIPWGTDNTWEYAHEQLMTYSLGSSLQSLPPPYLMVINWHCQPQHSQLLAPHTQEWLLGALSSLIHDVLLTPLQARLPQPRLSALCNITQHNTGFATDSCIQCGRQETLH